MPLSDAKTVSPRRWPLVVAVVFLALLAGYFFIAYGMQIIRIAWARGQIDIFSSMVAKAENADSASSAGFLAYAANYYPSGTKQTPGSHLDFIVEQARAEAVQKIIAQLKAQTGEDLGTNAGPWIERFNQESAGRP